MTTRLSFNSRGFRALLTNPAVQRDLEARAQRVASAAGEGYEALPLQPPRRRAHVIVAPVTGDADRDNAENNTLLRALDAGR